MRRRVASAAPRRWFHGTSLEAAEKILASGQLAPPKVLAEHYKGDNAFAPIEGLVYLTHDVELALTYVRIRSYKGRGKYGPGALIEVEPIGRCQADEDEIGAAVDFVLHEEQGKIFDGDMAGHEIDSSVGHMVLDHVPAALSAKWRRAPERLDGGWSEKMKAKVGKAALGALPREIIETITAQTRSVACEGAIVLRAWRVDPGKWGPHWKIIDEERARLPVSKTSYEQARAMAHGRHVDEHLPPLRLQNPVRGIRKPTVRSPLKKGQRLYHATSSPEDFDMLQGPAWVSDNKQAVEFFLSWHGRSEEQRRCRILTFEVIDRPKLAYIEDDRAWQQLLEWIDRRLGGDDGDGNRMGPEELAEAVCSAGFDGWHIVNNYNPGSDTLLCDPERWLRLVEVEEIQQVAKYSQFQRRPNPSDPWIFRKRFVYALTFRPASPWTVPKGFVEIGPATAEHPLGTVVFERPLPRREIEAFELEPLDADDPIVLKRARSIYRDEVYERFAGANGFEQADAEGGRATLSYSTRPGVEYQVTYWLADWTPTGHLDVNDFDEAVDALWSSMPKAERRQRALDAVWRAWR